jgi:hypothetical protein
MPLCCRAAGFAAVIPSGWNKLVTRRVLERRSRFTLPFAQSERFTAHRYFSKYSGTDDKSERSEAPAISLKPCDVKLPVRRLLKHAHRPVRSRVSTRTGSAAPGLDE